MSEKQKTPVLSWIPFAVSVFIYFISKAVAEAINLPVDMYTTVFIITVLFFYAKKALNKNTERNNNEL